MQINELSPALGAEVSDVDLARLSAKDDSAIREVLFEYGVVCFRDQSLTHESHTAFAQKLGPLETHPIVVGMEEHPHIIRMHKPAGQPASFGVGWHTDNTFFGAPSLGSVLYSEIIPSTGGDTLFASQSQAYQNMSGELRDMVAGMRAVHCAREAYSTETALEKYAADAPIRYRRTSELGAEVTHPVVIQHPVTGRKALFVNPMFTMRIDGMTEEESRPLLEELFACATAEAVQCRLTWAPQTLVVWDNRLVMHCALNDYRDEERLIYRITVNGQQLG